MAIPTREDYALAEIDNLHGNVMVRLKNFRWANARVKDPAAIREALVAYVDAVTAFVNGDEKAEADRQAD
ncbi:hypothetical protein [Bradyrhizobium sp. Ai1a-2]|uniref:hypothetical protein n=1 Tax=Bradyrhizobium sp. Ai1a-2 TaxID=196490 RepID=UPI00041BE061|nr:hypothetical protein [Bradyrhizobium sp. Ai1a-2]